MVNRQGLARSIPESAKKIVRRSCSFGCVICGAIPYDYDHLSTEFHEASTHDPDDIVLLCPTHHRMKGSGVLSVETIVAARKSKVAATSEFRFKLPATNKEFEVDWASNIISSAENSIVVDGSPILNFERTDNDLEPINISGQFRDRYGKVICQIANNEFVGRADTVGDFTLVANRFKYSLPNGLMGLSFNLSDSRLEIEYAFHVKDDVHVYAHDGILRVGNLRSSTKLENCRFSEMGRAIEVGSTCDGFVYDRADLNRFPTNSLVELNLSNGKVGVKVEGRRRLKITSNYDRG